jgi:hypothetical protein
VTGGNALQYLELGNLNTVLASLAIFTNAELLSVDLSLLQTVVSTFTLRNNPMLSAFEVPQLRVILQGDLEVTDNDILTRFYAPQLTYVYSGVNLYENPAVEEIILSKLTMAAGVGLLDNPNLLTADLSSLQEAGGMQIFRNPQMEAFDIRALQVTNGLYILTAGITILSAPQLTYAAGIGMITTTCGRVTFIHLPLLSVVTTLYLASNAALTYMDLSSLQVVRDIELGYNAKLEFSDLPLLQTISGLFTQGNTPVSRFYAPQLQYAYSISVWEGSKSTWIHLPSLTQVGVFGVRILPKLAVVDLSSLRVVDLVFAIEDTPEMTSCNLPALQKVDGGFSILSSGLSRLHAPLLTFAGGAAFGMSSVPSMTSVNLASLTRVAGTFSVIHAALLQEIDVSKLAHIGGDFQLNNAPILTRLSFTSLTFVGAIFHVTNCGMLASLAVPVLLYAPNRLYICNGVFSVPNTLTPDQCASSAMMCNLITCP